MAKSKSAPDIFVPAVRASRRDFLRMSSIGAVAIGACGGPPREKILPHHRAPRTARPGVPVPYATALERDGFAVGLLVQTLDGRPIKVEGHPEHPASLGATGPWEQAAIASLYDPRRARGVMHRGQPSSWKALEPYLGRREDAGRGLRLVVEPSSSPTRRRLLEAVAERHPEMRLIVHRPLQERLGEEEAGRRLHGAPLQPVYAVEQARRIVALDADPLGRHPFALSHARALASNRGSPEGWLPDTRVWTAGPVPTCTSAVADERLPCRSCDVPLVLAALWSRVVDGKIPTTLRERIENLESGLAMARWVRGVAEDLERFSGEGLVVASERHPWSVHALVWALNERLGNVGRTVRFVQSVADLGPRTRERTQAWPEFLDDVAKGRIDTCVVLDGDPAATASAFELAAALETIEHSICMTTFESTTSASCRWQVARAHPFESWGDLRAYDGTPSFVQPLISPLHPAKTTDEMLGALLGIQDPRGHHLVRETWRGTDGFGEPFEDRWIEALRRGFLPGSESSSEAVEFADAPGLEAAWSDCAHALASGALELRFEAHHGVGDGRHADNAWLQEMPDPITKQSWGNAAWLAPSTAASFGLEDGDVVRLRTDAGEVEAPVVLVPDLVPGTVVVTLGHGRATAGDFPDVGYDAFALGVNGPWRSDLELVATGKKRRLARTQTHFEPHGRDLALWVEAGELQHPKRFEHLRGPLPSLLPSTSHPGPQWGMTIDLTVCTGCSACVVACQAENNIPTVGPDEVARGREMHWLRIDRYVRPEPGAPVVYQPMMCQHCEHAPCEYVCPVGATVHSPGGLNEMVYNRCIGTRFCSNNCPYKVRRFNWFDYTSSSATQSLGRNPEVTVRARGVMEKCTYCVQRIRQSERGSERSDAHGELQTACQQACPTRAIAFGDLRDPSSEASQRRKAPHHYAELHHEGTRPRTHYLAKVVHPGPEVG